MSNLPLHDPDGSNGLLVESDFLEPPVFVSGSVGPHGKSVRIIGRDGRPRTLSIDVALVALHACRAADEAGGLPINADEFLELGEAC